ncbi:MAG: hypothetical protein QW146_03930 [Candidatus Bathyarchaeia archaeon]
MVDGDKKLQKFLPITVLVMVTTALMLAPCSHSMDVLVNEKALSFIKEVIQLDLSKYNVKIRDYFEEYSGRTVKKDITYTFEGTGSRLTVSCRFADDFLFDCTIWVNEGYVFYVQSPSSIFDRAMGILERYKKWTGDDSLNEMISLLKRVDVSKNVTLQAGNWMLKVSSTPKSTWLCWLYTVNGAIYPNCISITIEKNGAISFTDERSLYKIGSTEVRVSWEEAIAIALKHVANYSFEIFMGDQPSIVIKNFTIVREKIATELLSWPREDGAQYPYWKVDLPFDRLYPGNIYMICVNIWADTGEVFRCVPLGFGGSPPPQDSQPEQTTNPPETTHMLEWDLTPIVVLLLIFAILASSLILYKKWKKPIPHHCKQWHKPPSQPINKY